jgi:predicted Zn-ribbon and HTH transcriptional regulator
MGTIPGTSEMCGADLLETDGTQFFMRSLTGETFTLELDPPRLCCRKCGYKTRLKDLWKLNPLSGR